MTSRCRTSSGLPPSIVGVRGHERESLGRAWDIFGFHTRKVKAHGEIKSARDDLMIT